MNDICVHQKLGSLGYTVLDRVETYQGDNAELFQRNGETSPHLGAQLDF